MRLPDDSQHLAIVGVNGSGKTQAAAWHLSQRAFDRIPWIIYDFKGDELLNEIEGAETIDTKYTPKKKGLYIVHPLPDEQEQVAAQMWAIWQRENTGVYVDEGYMIGDSPAFRALLTQGRSKHIPIICLSQRPSWISRFLFSESNFYQIFRLNDKRDKKTVEAFVPINMDVRLPEYHSYYYDVKRDKVNVLTPVPNKEYILTEFEKKLSVRRKFI
jgi:hypothetical protein